MMRTLAPLILAAAFVSGPASAQGGFLGVSLENAEDGAGGALIAAVETRSAGAIAGLQAGDRITRVDGVEIADFRALAAVIGARLPGEIVELRLIRGGQPQELLAVLGRRPTAGRSGGGEAPQRPRFDLMPPLPQSPPQAWDGPDGDWDFEFPQMELRGFEFEGFAPRLEELQQQLESLSRRHAELMKDWGAQLQAPPRWPDSEGARTRVQLRYPESTSPAERERLRAEAVQQYGPEVEIEFSGTGTSVRIERTMSSSGGQGAHPPTPPPPGSPRDGQREF